MGASKALRKQCLQRDANHCRKCNKHFPKQGLQVHHVMPQRLRGPDELFNLVSLCDKCHTAWHRYEQLRDIEWNARLAVRVFYEWLSGASREGHEEFNQDLHNFQEYKINALLSELWPRRRRVRRTRNQLQTRQH